MKINITLFGERYSLDTSKNVDGVITDNSTNNKYRVVVKDGEISITQENNQLFEKASSYPAGRPCGTCKGTGRV
jgi:hypothetical protein